MKELLNGAPLPNWVKLIVLGGSIGILIGVNQASVTRISENQKETTTAIKELRAEIREKLVTRNELMMANQQIDAITRRIDIIEVKNIGK